MTIYQRFSYRLELLFDNGAYLRIAAQFLQKMVEVEIEPQIWVAAAFVQVRLD